MTIKNNPGLKEFLVRLGTTTAAIVLVMYLAKVWFVDPRLAVLTAQRPVSEQVATAVKVEEEALKPVIKVEEKEIKPVSEPQEPASKVISWKDAAKHVGEHATVEGTIVDIYNSGKVAKLNFDPDWKHTFSAIIFAKQFSKFPGSPNPENHYYGKKVRVTGRIKMYKGSPEIILEDPSQIKTSWKRTPVTSASTAPVKLISKKVDTDGDGIPDTFILKGETEKEPASLAKTESKIPAHLMKVTCTKVNDGDTIEVKLDDGSFRRVRLVGIDTPEVWRKTGTGWAEDPQPGAKKASKFTEKEVPIGQAVYLDVDDEEPADHYGRTLALVYTNLSNASKGPRYSLNAKLLQEGLAEVLFIPPSEFDPDSWK